MSLLPSAVHYLRLAQYLGSDSSPFWKSTVLFKSDRHVVFLKRPAYQRVTVLRRQSCLKVTGESVSLKETLSIGRSLLDRTVTLARRRDGRFYGPRRAGLIGETVRTRSVVQVLRRERRCPRSENESKTVGSGLSAVLSVQGRSKTGKSPRQDGRCRSLNNTNYAHGT